MSTLWESIFGGLDNPGRAVGIDPAQIRSEDKWAHRGMTLSALGRQMQGGPSMYQTLSGMRQSMDERKAKELELQQKQMEIEAAQRQQQVYASAFADEPQQPPGAPVAPPGTPGMPGAPGAPPGPPPGPPQIQLPPELAQRKNQADRMRAAAMRILKANPGDKVGVTFLQEAERLFPIQKNAKPETVMINGVPTLASWNEATGQFTPVQGFQPERTVSRTIRTAGPDGRPVEQQMDQYGDKRGQGMPGYVAPVQMDTGGQVGFVDPHAVAAGGPVTKTMDAAQTDASKRGWAGHGLNQAQFAHQKTVDGVLMAGATGAALPGAVGPVGKAPSGMYYAQDGKGGITLKPIPGSEADVELRSRDGADTARLGKVGEVLSAVQDAKKAVGWTTSGAASIMSRVPGSPARDLEAKLTTIKANLGFDTLQAMRDASPTGGALGQVAVQELTALQASVASLDQAQSPTQLKANLETIERSYKRVVNVINQGRKVRGLPPLDVPVSPGAAKPAGAAPPAQAPQGGGNVFLEELQRRQQQQRR